MWMILRYKLYMILIYYIITRQDSLHRINKKYFTCLLWCYMIIGYTSCPFPASARYVCINNHSFFLDHSYLFFCNLIWDRTFVLLLLCPYFDDAVVVGQRHQWRQHLRQESLRQLIQDPTRPQQEEVWEYLLVSQITQIHPLPSNSKTQEPTLSFYPES